MKHPKISQVIEVRDRLQRYVDQNPEAKLDMRVAQVNIMHVCGTVHCHAGNYAVQCLSEGILDGLIDYSYGSVMMTYHLGFDEPSELEIWAHNNENIWGNINGYNMFISPEAFTPKGKSKAENNQDIVDHWSEVIERMKAAGLE